MKNATTTVGARISIELAQRLSKAADRKANPFAPTMSQIIAQGIELALKELQKESRK